MKRIISFLVILSLIISTLSPASLFLNAYADNVPIDTIFFQRIQYTGGLSKLQYVIALPTVISNPQIIITDEFGPRIIDTTKYPAASLLNGGNQIIIDKDITISNYGSNYNSLFSEGSMAKSIKVIDRFSPSIEYTGTINIVSPPYINELKDKDNNPIADNIFYIGDFEKLIIEGSNLNANSTVTIDGTYYPSPVIMAPSRIEIDSVNKVGTKSGELRISSQDNKIQTIFLNRIYTVKRLSGIDIESVTPNTGSVDGGTYVKIKNKAGLSGLNDTLLIYFPRIIDGIPEEVLTSNKAQIVGFDSDTNTLTVKTKASTSGPGEARIVITDIEGTSRYDDSDNLLTYTFIQGGNALTLNKVDPKTAKASSQSVVEITGKNIVTLNISGLTYTGSPNYDDENIKVENIKDGGKIKTEVTIANLTYNLQGQDKKVNVKKVVMTQIGDFAATELNGDKFSSQCFFSLSEDKLAVKLPIISKINTYDVIVTTQTYIYEDLNENGTIDIGETELIPSIIEEAVSENSFTYVDDFLTPNINSISPELGPLDKSIFVTIKGSNFLVIQQGDNILTPLLYIGTNESNPKDPSTMKKLTNISVYNMSGDKLKIVDGSLNNDKGTIIKAEIPASPDAVANVESTLYIYNQDGGQPGKYKKFVFKSPEVEGSPIITDVNPNIVSTGGGTTVKVIGSNFKNTQEEKTEVYIDGEKVTPITINGTGEEISFLSPKGRSGASLIQIINTKTGAMDSAPFQFTDIYTAPKLDRVSPDVGGANTRVTLVGENFLNTDVTAKPNELYRIIGVRSLFNGKDINEYNMNNGYIELLPFGKEGENILTKNGSKIYINPYYKDGILVESGNESIMTMSEDIKGEISIRDAYGNTYTPIIEGNEIRLVDKDGIKSSSIQFENIDGAAKMSFTIGTSPEVTHVLTFKTPYKIDNTKGEIVGRRVFVIDSNTLEIIVPPIGTGIPKQGDNDITIVNPDTASDTIIDGFFYFKTQGSSPVITDVEPKEGAKTGGMLIKITGSDFRESASVYFGGEKSKTVNVIPGGNIIYAELPEFTGILDPKTESATVPVVIVNEEDGGTAVWDDRFTYRVPTSYPKINSIEPNKWNASGGIDVIILGENFMEGEPFTDLNGDGSFNENEPFADLNGNGNYDKSCQNPDYTIEGELAPRVYFGGEKAEVVDFSYKRLIVRLPKYPGDGAVDVVIVNPDNGTVVKKSGFTYTVSTPKMTSIVPAVGPKAGGTEISINGEGFIIDSDMNKSVQVFIGDETKDVGTGTIIGTKLSSELKLGNLSIDYDSMGISQDTNNPKRDTKLTMTYRVKAKTDETVKDIKVDKYIDVTAPEIADGEEIFIYFEPNDFIAADADPEELSKLIRSKEYIKLKVRDGVMTVTRRLCEIDTLNSSSKMIIVKGTPPSATIGLKDLIVINSDGGRASSKFEYGNPVSNPKIACVLPNRLFTYKDGETTKHKYLVEVTKQGGSEITIKGQDFREGVKVFIGDQEAEVLSKDAEDTTLIVKVPAAKIENIEKELKITVINSDTATAVSTQYIGAQPEGYYPYYFVYKDSTTNPTISSVSPNKGPMMGGTKIIIAGDDFREGAKVFVGGVECQDVVVVRYNMIEATTREIHNPGTYAVEVKNFDGDIITGTAVLDKSFTYVSDPHIVNMFKSAGIDQNGSQTLGESTHEIVITGGEDIILELDGLFGDSVQVVFGAKLQVISDFSNIPEGIKGTTASGGDVVVTGGTLATVTKIQSQRYIIIKTPTGTEGPSNIIVINSDGGVSESFGITYIRSLPDKPSGLTALVVDGNAIKLEWDRVEGITKYQIMASFGTSSTDKALQSFYYLVTIEPESISEKRLRYYIKSLKPSTYYRFRVKSINEFGVSTGYSESSTVITDEVIRSESIYIKPDIPSIQRENTIKTTGDKVTYTLSEKSIKESGSQYFIDWRLEAKAKDKRELIVPLDIVMRYEKDYTLYDNKVYMNFNNESLKTKEVLSLDSYIDSALNVTIKDPKGQRYDEIITSLNRKYQMITAISVEFLLQQKKDTINQAEFSDYIELSIKYDTKAVGDRKLYLMYYDVKSSSINEVTASDIKNEAIMKARVKKTGSYIIVRQR